MSIRILIVDDHPVVVSGLRAMFAQQADLTVVGEAVSLAQARSALARGEVDVTLLDLRLPDGLGFELLRDAADLPSPPAFIVLSSFESAQYIDAAIRHGASGYLLKTAPSDELLAAIRRVAEGGTAFSAEHLLAVSRSGWAPLGARDRRLVELLLTGHTNKEMAAALGVTRQAVEMRLAHLCRRFDLESRVELALRAEREGWLSVPGSAKEG
jgi:DNA-binding NarL/FixJ family response regulator